jgi:uncharacterized membrane protein YgcG
VIALAFALILLLAIWLAIRLGGVRKRDRSADTGRDGSIPAASSSDTDSKGTSNPGGGSFGGGGASGSWGDGSGSDGDGGGGGD